MGPTLFGGAVGAAIGIAIHVALEAFAHIQAPWIAVVIGLLTGLGVRKATYAKHPGANYARGALSGLLGLAAIVASPYVVKAAFQRTGVDVVTVTGKSSTNADEATDAETRSEADDQTASDGKDATSDRQRLRGDDGNQNPLTEMRRAAQASDSTWQFIYMAVGAFLAYELGRGGEKKAPGDERPVEPVVTTDPSN